MTCVKQIAGLAALGAALLLGLCTPSAQAAYIVTLTQQGSNVVASGSGTLDTAGLSFLGSSMGDEAGIDGSVAIIVVGPVNFQPSDDYVGFSGPVGFGDLGFITASSGSGDRVGIDNDSGELFVPAGYVSGNPLSSSAIWDNKTISGLGVTPGTYTWNWGSGATADSFTLDIGAAAVPEPSSLLLLALPLGLVLLLAARSRRTPGNA